MAALPELACKLCQLLYFNSKTLFSEVSAALSAAPEKQVFLSYPLKISVLSVVRCFSISKEEANRHEHLVKRAARIPAAPDSRRGYDLVYDAPPPRTINEALLKSPAKQVQPSLTFDDVGGQDARWKNCARSSAVQSSAREESIRPAGCCSPANRVQAKRCSRTPPGVRPGCSSGRPSVRVWRHVHRHLASRIRDLFARPGSRPLHGVHR